MSVYLVIHYKEIRTSIATEEATKTSMIMPFFQILGYDVFNPLEFVPEYTADVGTKKKEKVDYAIMVDNIPSITYTINENKATDRRLVLKNMDYQKE